MANYRTKFGMWLSIFCAKHRISVAHLSEILGVSPTTMSLVISGQQTIPAFLRENIISAFALPKSEIEEMDNSICETQTEAVVIDREFEQYIMVQTPNNKDWTKELMELMAKKVNSMTADEANEFRNKLLAISEDKHMSGVMNISPYMIESQVYKRYAKRPDIADRIMNYIKANME